MKKLAIGCAIVLVLAGAVIAGVSYYAYRQARAMFAQFAELGQVPEIEQRVRNKSAFVAPANEELTARQVERLVQVQTRVRQRIGERFGELERKYKVLADKREATIADAPTLLAAYRDLAAGWLEAKRIQVDALNEAGLSLQEYRWIRDQAYKAIGVPFMDFDVGADVPMGASGAPACISMANKLRLVRPRYVVDVQQTARIEQYPGFPELLQRDYYLEAEFEEVKLYRSRDDLTDPEIPSSPI